MGITVFCYTVPSYRTYRYGGIPEIEKEFYYSLAISAPIGISATVLYMKALDAGDISLISPISGLSPLLLLITTPLIVNEFPSALGLVGVMIATLGVYLLEVNKASANDVLQPFKSLFSNPGAKYILLVVILYSVSAPVDKIAVEASSPIMYTLALHIVIAAALTPMMIYKNGYETLPKIKKDIKWVSAVGALSGLASLLQMIALTYTLVVYVIAVKRCGIIISVVSVVCCTQALCRCMRPTHLFSLAVLQSPAWAGKFVIFSPRCNE